MDSTILRLALLSAGWLAVALAVLGLILPLLPTTPFVLVAAGCFSRASERCHRWLLSAPVIGRLLADWEAGRGVALAVRIKAIALVWIGIGSSVVWFVDATAARVLLLAIAATVSAYLLRLPAPGAPVGNEERATRKEEREKAVGRGVA